MYQFERKEKIMHKLNRVGQIRINQEAQLLGVSLPTLHRDLLELEKQGLIEKVQGGAILSSASESRTRFDIRIKTNVKEKKEVAIKAAKMIEDETCIFLDHSSTTTFLARELERRHFHNLIVLTNSLAIPFELRGKNGVQIILTGGVFESEFKAVSGHWVIDSIKSLNLHQIFVSVGAISLEHGLMTQTHFINELFCELFLYAPKTNILVDSSKFFKIGTFQIAPLSPSFVIITDRGISRTLQTEIEKKGPKIIV